jgi:5,10-methylene-tetrahydrofolate dehydrogenase/methenyl tetrahydrofolate cyclohydrolase
MKNFSASLAIKKNANQNYIEKKKKNYIEIPSHSSQNSYHQDSKQQKLLRMQGIKDSQTVGGNVN